MSKIKQTKDGLIEKSTERKIESPLDTTEQSRDVLSSMQSAIASLRSTVLYCSQLDTREECQAMIETLQTKIDTSIRAKISLANNSNCV